MSAEIIGRSVCRRNPQFLVVANRIRYQKILHNIYSQRSPNDIVRIRRVFAWLRCRKGQRPLQKYEVRLGMMLGDDVTRLTYETRPFANATEICKPLIENKPGNTIGFVHSTVPQYGGFDPWRFTLIFLLIACSGSYSKILLGLWFHYQNPLQV